MKSYVIDMAQVPWTPGETEGLTFQCQALLDGADGGPEALRFRFDPTPSVYAHMHLTAQFQLVLGGEMHMPRGMHLGPLDVHYTDHCVPYGPFAVDNGHDMLVLHAKRGGLISMSDDRARAEINLAGRLLIGSAGAAPWSTTDSAIRLKPIIRSPGGPDVTLAQCAPGSALRLDAPPFGRYELLLEGSASVDGQEVAAPTLRYAEGSEEAPPLTAGPDGATVVVLTFDRDARLGGLDAYSFGLSAEQALANAI